MTELSSIFDMIGPVMIGPSSSHTAGVARIGRMARKILTQEPCEAVITFYNSFAATYEGHGSDKAVVAGLLDMAPDDPRLKESLNLAREKNIRLIFQSVHSAPKYHPNTIRIYARSTDNQIEVLGISRGGGLITISEIDGFHANLSGTERTLIIQADDVKGSIAYLANAVAHDDCNIATLIVTRKAKHQTAMLIFELDSGLRPLTIEYIKSLSWVKKVNYIE
ncbi:MAG: L-serine ammonia-lyase, iron-sulfur-dependent subunit beta [Bacteroidia bacterium]|nr:L-serine ammonia-lyase, iron-sulfur-dependent subunit beta [Bacteroidia bacterium]